MMDLLSRWAPGLLVFAAIALGTVALGSLWEAWRDRRRRKQAREFFRRALSGSAMDADTSAADALLQPSAAARSGGLSGLLSRLPRASDFQPTLRRAGLDLAPHTYLLLTAGLALAASGAALVLGAGPVVVTLGAATGALAPYAYVRRRISRRLRAFEEQLPEAIDLMTRAIRAGHPFSAGLRMVAEEMADPIAGELGQAFEAQRFGLPVKDALMELVDRVPLVDVRILVTAILIQREVGGNLAEILDKLANVIRERFRLRRQLRVYTAQGRVSGYVLAALPIAVGLIFYALNPDYMRTLFEHPIGYALLITGLVLQVIGFFWIRRIIDIEL